MNPRRSICNGAATRDFRHYDTTPAPGPAPHACGTYVGVGTVVFALAVVMALDIQPIPQRIARGNFPGKKQHATRLQHNGDPAHERPPSSPATRAAIVCRTRSMHVRAIVDGHETHAGRTPGLADQGRPRGRRPTAASPPPRSVCAGFRGRTAHQARPCRRIQQPGTHRTRNRMTAVAHRKPDRSHPPGQPRIGPGLHFTAANGGSS